MADKFRETISTALPGYSKTAGIGGALGAGLGQGLQALVQDKLKEIVRKKEQSRTGQGIEALLGIAPEKAHAIAGMDLNFFRQLERSRYTDYLNKQMASKQGTTTEPSFLQMRKTVLKQLSPENKEKIMAELVQRGYKPEEISVLTGTTLTEPIAQYFLDKAKGNKKKARTLAKKHGYTF